MKVTFDRSSGMLYVYLVPEESGPGCVDHTVEFSEKQAVYIDYLPDGRIFGFDIVALDGVIEIEDQTEDK